MSKNKVEKKEKIKKGKGSMAKILNKCSSPLGSLIFSLATCLGIDFVPFIPIASLTLALVAPSALAGIIIGCIKLYSSSGAMASFFDSLLPIVVILMLPIFVLMFVGIVLEFAIVVFTLIMPIWNTIVSIALAGASFTNVIFTYAKKKSDSYNKAAITGAATTFSILAIVKAIKSVLVFIMFMLLSLVIPVVLIVCGFIFIPKLF